MKTKTDIKAGYANSKLELTTPAIERLELPELIERVESLNQRAVFKTGHMVAAILE